jgi:hypothetical protein
MEALEKKELTNRLMSLHTSLRLGAKYVDEQNFDPLKELIADITTNLDNLIEQVQRNKL